MPLKAQSEDKQELVIACNPVTVRRGQEAVALDPTEVLVQNSTHCTRSVLTTSGLKDTV